jgi:hypothetical protein
VNQKIKGIFGRINHMRKVDGRPENAVPDVRKLGLEIFEEFEVSEKVRFGQVVGYVVDFACANRSATIPNVVLVVMRCKWFGQSSDNEETTIWGIFDEFWYEEWKKHHGFPIKVTLPIALAESA